MPGVFSVSAGRILTSPPVPIGRRGVHTTSAHAIKNAQNRSRPASVRTLKRAEARAPVPRRDWRAAFTPLQLTPSRTRKIVQRLRRCGRGSGLKPARRFHAATGARRLRRFSSHHQERAKSFNACVGADAEAG
jgi:hypothetical protein